MPTILSDAAGGKIGMPAIAAHLIKIISTDGKMINMEKHLQKLNGLVLPSISDKAIAKIAKLVCSHFDRGSYSAPRDFIEHIIKSLGGKIRYMESPEDIEDAGGSITIYPNRSFVIRISPYTAPHRDIFTIAHDLGHYLLHVDFRSKFNNPISFSRFGSNIFEWQANKFALELLLPTSEFRVLQKTHEDYYLASHFGVSEKAVEMKHQMITGSRKS